LLNPEPLPLLGKVGVWIIEITTRAGGGNIAGVIINTTIVRLTGIIVEVARAGRALIGDTIVVNTILLGMLGLLLKLPPGALPAAPVGGLLAALPTLPELDETQPLPAELMPSEPPPAAPAPAPPV
jgi:hypothetical protein